MKARLLREGETVPGPSLLPYTLPENTAIVVIEDDTGKVVARLGVYRVTLLEGLWIDPEAQKNLGVTRELLGQALSIPSERGEKWVFGTAGDEKMSKVVGRLGIKVPADFYSIPIGG